ncbi:class II aldolase/adducin family protein, partial [Candidatus Bathyarchaeota archaeon]|nr:class II aldolase/adducin family protein [Candidatus Bathyarchaeota archaeon]
YRIYQLRRDVNAIFHGHDELIIRNAKSIGAVETREWQPYGTLELIKSVEKVLNGNNFIVVKNHGFISLGRSMEEAGKLALMKRIEAENI